MRNYKEGIEVVFGSGICFIYLLDIEYLLDMIKCCEYKRMS